MKKTLYILLLAAELLVGMLMMGLMYSNIGWVFCVVILAVTAALMIRLILQLKKETDKAARKKTRRRIALVLLIPAAVGLLIALYVLISLFICFG